MRAPPARRSLPGWGLVLALFVLGWATPIMAGAITVRDLLDDPLRYEGEVVVVTGVFGNVRSSRLKNGQRQYTFDLSTDSSVVTAISAGPPSCTPGTTVTISGRVEVKQHRHGLVVKIDATRIDCQG
jgi:DNA/RNA endonuclease YhcR with UshA esterase domain